MKARLPASTKLTKEQLAAAEEYARNYWRNTEFAFYFATMISLNEHFGFSNGRLKTFVKGIEDVMAEINYDIDTGCSDILIAKLVRALESRHIDYEKLFDITVTLPDSLHSH